MLYSTYNYFCPQFFQGITIVMNIINLEGGSPPPPPPPPRLRPCVYRLQGLIQGVSSHPFEMSTNNVTKFKHSDMYMGVQLESVSVLRGGRGRISFPHPPPHHGLHVHPVTPAAPLQNVWISHGTDTIYSSLLTPL